MELKVTPSEAKLIEASLKLPIVDREALDIMRRPLLRIAQALAGNTDIILYLDEEQAWLLRDAIQIEGMPVLQKIYRLLLDYYTMQIPSRKDVEIPPDEPRAIIPREKDNDNKDETEDEASCAAEDRADP
jgi:hypothetical protein